jgi:uncharacterized tellurite resistance protein B-like protein
MLKQDHFVLTKLINLITNSTKSEASAANQPALDAALAATALLFEVARVDMNVSGEELTNIQEAAKNLFNLSDNTVHDFLSQSQDMSQKSTSYYEFTAVINSHWDEEQKYTLVKALWSLANADGVQCKYEEHLIRRIADLLHALFTKARHEITQEL